MKFNKPEVLPEANIQAELYHRFKLMGIDSYLEISFEVSGRIYKG